MPGIGAARHDEKTDEERDGGDGEYGDGSTQAGAYLRGGAGGGVAAHAAALRVGSERGYAVAATQRAGVGYVVASDLNPDKNAQLAALVYDDR